MNVARSFPDSIRYVRFAGYFDCGDAVTLPETFPSRFRDPLLTQIRERRVLAQSRQLPAEAVSDHEYWHGSILRHSGDSEKPFRASTSQHLTDANQPSISAVISVGDFAGERDGMPCSSGFAATAFGECVFTVPVDVGPELHLQIVLSLPTLVCRRCFAIVPEPVRVRFNPADLFIMSEPEGFFKLKVVLEGPSFTGLVHDGLHLAETWSHDEGDAAFAVAFNEGNEFVLVGFRDHGVSLRAQAA